MKISNEIAQRAFELDRKQIANFIALFSSLKIGDEYSSNFGRIIKTDDETFKIVTTSKNYDKILEELIQNEDEIYDIFNSR